MGCFPARPVFLSCCWKISEVLSDAVKNNINLLTVSSVKGKVSVFSAILLLQISTVQVDIDVNIWFGCIFVQMLSHFAAKD
jgi:hypothetical protein